MASLRVAVDVGGTFTDICILDEAEGSIDVRKVPSTADPIDAVVDGVAEAGIDLRDVVVFSHGTTVATNALITRNPPPAARSRRAAGWSGAPVLRAENHFVVGATERPKPLRHRLVSGTCRLPYLLFGGANALRYHRRRTWRRCLPKSMSPQVSATSSPILSPV